MIQKTLEIFLKEGHWDRHLRRIRNLNRKKHDLMKQALLTYLDDTIEILSEGGGLCINIRPTVNIDLDHLRKKAQQEEVKLYYTDRSLIGYKAIQMDFGGFEMDEIEPAVKVFAKVWNNL